MRISIEEAKKISKLSKLGIPDNEMEYYQKNINAILNSLNKLSDVNVDGIEPMFHPLDEEPIMREDKVEQYGNVDELQRLSQGTTEDGFYLVPKIIE